MMTIDYNLLWFFLVGVLLTGYAILDGFDLGVGSLHLFTRNDHDRRILMNSIGPVWDGNEVWLVTGGGALFAAFPEAYATAFSGFYLAFMLVLFALIFRAVALEFRSKRPERLWRGFWDVSFSVASTLAALLFGVAVGNMIQGVPVGADREFVGNLLTLLTPYPLLVGVLTVAMFTMHGGIFLLHKTEGELHQSVRMWCWRAFGTFLALYMITTIVTLILVPNATRNFADFPWVWIVVALTVLAIANIPRALFHDLPLRAFVSSAATIAGLIFLFGIAMYPNLIVSSLGPEFNLTADNAASSQTTLKIMAIIAAIGMPFVMTYTIVIYWIFRGKTQIAPTSY
ncbi:cytochrome d ubiquinol oxidase subunit II [candidate division BRC1 bacterium HGW-BRC1-1]|jgi:cytochrome d ubiquinol oxidase subunit II|nr:MAG: cytochrome d ubiquinol oxidase subunit II [candidate division BRC1 bacterium HGW-BRC1-1]